MLLCTIKDHDHVLVIRIPSHFVLLTFNQIKPLGVIFELCILVYLYVLVSTVSSKLIF